RVLVTTGAGMSQDSGIPTFRDAAGGLWARYDPEELATEAAFRRHPARVFGWYAWRRRLVRAAAPHAGYHALVALEGLVPEPAIVTQNVDGLHTRAGSRRASRHENRSSDPRSEEHTSELQSPDHLVCRLLLEKK